MATVQIDVVELVKQAAKQEGLNLKSVKEIEKTLARIEKSQTAKK